jgi:hypothetical protein
MKIGVIEKDYRLKKNEEEKTLKKNEEEKTSN